MKMSVGVGEDFGVCGTIGKAELHKRKCGKAEKSGNIKIRR